MCGLCAAGYLLSMCSSVFLSSTKPFAVCVQCACGLLCGSLLRGERRGDPHVDEWTIVNVVSMISDSECEVLCVGL